jgi:hypothetical protein
MLVLIIMYLLDDIINEKSICLSACYVLLASQLLRACLRWLLLLWYFCVIKQLMVACFLIDHSHCLADRQFSVLCTDYRVNKLVVFLFSLSCCLLVVNQVSPRKSNFNVTYHELMKVFFMVVRIVHDCSGSN